MSINIRNPSLPTTKTAGKVARIFHAVCHLLQSIVKRASSFSRSHLSTMTNVALDKLRATTCVGPVSPAFEATGSRPSTIAPNLYSLSVLTQQRSHAIDEGLLATVAFNAVERVRRARVCNVTFSTVRSSKQKNATRSSSSDVL